MRLDIGVFRTEQLLGPLDGQRFDGVDVFAATVIPATWVTFGVFVGEHGSHRLHHGGAGVVLARDQRATGLGITETLVAGLEELERSRKRSALRGLRGRVKFELDLDATRR
jgi:hypothetical protein